MSALGREPFNWRKWMQHQWQTFTDEEIMTQLAQREAGNC